MEKSLSRNKNKILVLISFAFFFPLISYCQNNNDNLIKTIENTAGKKRRELFLDSSMNIIKEVYFEFNNSKKIAEILYFKNKILIKGFDTNENMVFEYQSSDSVGFYRDFQSGVFLQFDKEGFNGIQKSKNVIINYSNNNKNGRLIQIDNEVVGQKNIIVGRVDWRYLKYDIDKYYYSIEKENVYKDYTGLILNFSNDKLDGTQKSLFVNNKVKFTATYKNGKLINYNSFDTSKNIISKIETFNGISLSNYILNGSLITNKKNYVFLNEELASVGDIYTQDDGKDISIKLTNGSDFGNIKDFIDIKDFNSSKKLFDDNKYFLPSVEALKILYKIPNYGIKGYKYDNEEDLKILPVEVKINIPINDKVEYKIDTLNFSNSYYTLYHNYVFSIDNHTKRFYTFSNNFYWNPDKSNNYFNDYLQYNNKVMKVLNLDYGLPNTFFEVDKEEGNTEESWFYDTTQQKFKYILEEVVDKMLQNLNKYKELKRPDLYTENGEKYISKDYIAPFGDGAKSILLIGRPITIANSDNRKCIKIYSPYHFEITDENGVYFFIFDSRFKTAKYLQWVEIKQL